MIRVRRVGLLGLSVTLAGLLMLALPPARGASTDAREPSVTLAKLPAEAPPAAPFAPQTPKTNPAASKGTPGAKMMAQADSPATAGLSAAELIDMAFDYQWYWNPAAMRACLAAAAALPSSKETGLALALLAEQIASAGDAAGAQAALDQVRAGYSDPETLDFAALSQQLAQAADDIAREALLAGYLDKHQGSLTGGWVALRLGRSYQDRPETGLKALQIFESTAKLYAGSVIGDEAILGIADTARRREVGDYSAVAVYSGLLETTTSDRLQRWATEGLAYRLMGLGQYQSAYDLLSRYRERWPQWANLKCIAMQGEPALKLGIAGPLEPGIRAALPSIPWPWYQAQAHYILGEIAFLRRDLDAAESEFAAARTAGWPEAGSRGLAECRVARGDLASALSIYLSAAEDDLTGDDKARALYAAARVAESMGDQATFGQIVARMTAELPGSGYTTRLAGHAILPAPGI